MQPTIVIEIDKMCNGKGYYIRITDHYPRNYSYIIPVPRWYDLKRILCVEIADLGSDNVAYVLNFTKNQLPTIDSNTAFVANLYCFKPCEARYLFAEMTEYFSKMKG